MVRLKNSRYIFLLLNVFLLNSCTTYLEEINSIEVSKPQNIEFDPTTFIQGRGYTQHAYIDTIQRFSYIEMYVETAEMFGGNGKSANKEVKAQFTTYSNWVFNDSLLTDSPIYHTYPNSPNFESPKEDSHFGLSPRMTLRAKQLIGPISKISVIKNDSIRVYIDVSYNGVHHIKDSVLIVLHAKIH
jgi:hypothetical protein